MRAPARLALFLSYAAFVSLGLPDTVLGVAWPSLRHRFGLSPADIGTVLVCAVSGYVVSGLLAGHAIVRAGVGGVLAGSSALVAAGLFGYSLAPSWPLFFPMAAVIGLGSGAIDAGLNTYAARHFPVRHVNWLHAFWGVGATLGPALMTAALARGAGYDAGYGSLGGILALMAIAFGATRRLWDDPASAASETRSSPRDGARSTLRMPAAWLQIGAFFLYAGVEASIGVWCFTVLREGRGLSVEAAGAWTAFYWGSVTAGRFLLGGLADRVGPDRLLRGTTVTAVVGVALFAMSEGLPGRLGLVVLGASLAPIFPTLMARTPARLGASAAPHAVGFQVSAATLGAALWPWAVGVWVARAGVGIVGAAATAMAVAFLLAHEALLARSSRLAGR